MLSSYRPPDTGGDRVADSVYRLPSCGQTSYNDGMYASRKATVLRKNENYISHQTQCRSEELSMNFYE